MSVTVLLIRKKKAESKGRNTPRNNLAALERLPEVLLDLLMSNISTKLLLHGNLPSQDFLIGESNFFFFCNPVETPHTHENHSPMKGSGESEERGRVREIRVGQSRVDQIWKYMRTSFTRKMLRSGLTSGMGRCISSFVVSVQSNVKTKVLCQAVVCSVPKHVGIIP